eukprot:4196828-Amphidinium_carterae.1
MRQEACRSSHLHHPISKEIIPDSRTEWQTLQIPAGAMECPSQTLTMSKYKVLRVSVGTALHVPQPRHP